MHTFLTVVHVFTCIAMILVVLLQTGKGADMGAAFGGSSQTIFGSSGPGTFLGKMTTAIAVVFMLTSLFLAYTSFHKTSSIMEGTSSPEVEQTIPVDQSASGRQDTTVPAEKK